MRLLVIICIVALCTLAHVAKQAGEHLKARQVAALER